MLIQYESYDSFVAYAAKIEPNNPSARRFTGHKSYAEAIELAQNGDSELVSQAEEMLDSLAEVGNGEAIQTWQGSPMGAYPVVPEFLAGHPTCMRSRCESEDVSPVNIYAATTISALLTRRDLMSRGTAILALVMKLQQVRPVQLWLTAETNGKKDGDCIQVIPMQSNPISIAHVCNALTSNHFARHLTYEIAEKRDRFNGNWGATYNELGGGTPKGAIKYEKWIRQYIGMNPLDLYIKPGHCEDALIANPIAWVNEQLARFSGNEVE